MGRRPAGRRGAGPTGRKRGKEEKKRFCFSFSIALFQIHFQKVFETFLHLNQIQSSQKYNAAAWMHEHVSILIFVLNFSYKLLFP
jgi:hypothetical protein